MKKVIFGLIFVVGFGLAMAPRSYTSMVDRVSSSIVRITGLGPEGSYVCTGEVIKPNRVLTAAHCMGESLTADGAAAKILFTDAFYDLALLDVPTNKPNLPIRTTPMDRFDHVTAFGYAFGWTKLFIMDTQIILLNTPVVDGQAPGIITKPASISGMSGGPLVDNKGEMVGILQKANDGVGYGVNNQIIQVFLLSDE